MKVANEPVSGGALFRRLTKGLEKTRARLLGGKSGLIKSKPYLDGTLLEELKLQLLSADIGVETTARILADVEQALKQHATRQSEVSAVLHESMLSVLSRSEQQLTVPDKKPFVILVVGVNGVGKTTTTGKLAQLLQQDGHSVLLAAADTFRAAAIEQLQYWGARVKAPVIAQAPGADAAAVLYNTLQAAGTRGTDIVIADTAGRLHNQENLMAELKKIHRAIHKFDALIRVETLLVVDAGTGMNAIVQAQRFQQVVEVTGVVLTKLDGTAKGGMAFALAQQLSLPIRYIGTGETADDLQPFNAGHFVRALLDSRP